jgi:hypothetical protein
MAEKAQPAKHLGRDIGQWASSGFSITESKELRRRLSICHSCDLWDPLAYASTGACKSCNCSTQARLRMETLGCPEGKW